MTGFSKLQFGDGLSVTDQTGGVIRVDGAGGEERAPRDLR
jgi:hypothetical protein